MKYIPYILILILVFALGCTEKPIGGERDEHGCLPTAGYTWCEAKQKCLRTWEEECLDINSFEECIAAGNPAMESYPRQCMAGGRTFTEVIDIETRAKQFCGGENIANVYICGDYIKVVSLLPGAGSTFYRSDLTEVQCPVVAPDSMTEECRKLTFEPDCEEKEIC